MKTFIEILCFAGVGMVLATVNVGIYDWQLYAILIAMSVVSSKVLK